MAASREFIGSVPREEVGDSVSNVRVTMEHFEDALDEVQPSVTEETKRHYEEIERKFNRSDVDDADDPVVGEAFQ